MGLRAPGNRGGDVQRYSNNRVETRVQQANVQDPRRLGSDLGDQVNRLGGAFVDAYSRQKQRADEVAALEQQNKLAAVQNQLLYDPQNGAFNKKGKNAFSTLGEVNEAYDKAYAELDNSLVNEQQKQMLRRSYLTSRVDINRQLQRHISTQAEEYDRNTTNAGMALEQQAVATNPLDNERRTMALGKQRMMIEQYASANGFSEEQKQLMLQDAENKTNLGALTSLVDSRDYINAKKYFEDTKDTMTGEYRSRAERLVKESVTQGQAQEFTDQVMMDRVPLGEAYKRANEQIKDPELRKATISMIRDSYRQKDEADAYNAEQINKRVASQIDRGVLWKDIPQSTKDLLTSSQRSQLEGYASERMKGRDVPSGGIKYYDLYSIANNPQTRNQFMNMNLYTEAYGKVSKSEFDELYKKQAGLKNGSAKEVNEANALYSNKQIADSIAKSNGIYASSDDSGSKYQTYTNYSVAVDSAVRNFEQNTGKKATGEDVRRIAESLIIEKKVNDDWFGSKKMRFEAEPGENTVLEYQDIPKQELAAIQQAMKAKRVNLSEDQILQIYLQKINGR